MKSVVVIGAGLAGYSFIREFRKYDMQSQITLICGDRGNHYSKPDLSAALTRGQSPEALIIKTAEDMAEQFQIRMMTTTWVNSIDRVNKCVETSTSSVPYDELIIATGAFSNRFLPSELDACAVNDLESYQRFIQRVQEHPTKSVSILGSGLIACEFANDLLNITNNIKIYSLAPYALPGLVPPPISEKLQNTLEQRGVEWHLNLLPHEIETQLNPKDVILEAIGLTPNTAIARACGLEVNKGIVCNRFGQTNDPFIYSLGDCAEIEGFWLPYIMPITCAARALAKTVAGEQTAIHYPCMPVIVKTSLYPISILLPQPVNQASWSTEHMDGDLVATSTCEGATNGYVLTGKQSRTAMLKAKTLSDWLAPS